jgi:hypothetical protein
MLSPPLPDIWDSDDCDMVVGDMFMGAVCAARNMAAKRRCAAALNCAHHFVLGQVDVPCICRTPGSTMGAENIRDLQRLYRHGGL